MTSEPTSAIISKVINGLYVGGINAARDRQMLKSFGVTHILVIHDRPEALLSNDFEYLLIEAADGFLQNIRQFFPRCNDFIVDARRKDGVVYVHCLVGVSRSVSIVVAHLMSITLFGMDDALDAVRQARPYASPNPNFLRQLRYFETNDCTKERERLKGKFGNELGQQSSKISDYDQCKELILQQREKRSWRLKKPIEFK